MERVHKTKDAWREHLTPEQYHVCRCGGTEMPGSGMYEHNKAHGTYSCVCCGQDLFTSDAKYESGSGWPSFWKAINTTAVLEHDDVSHNMLRTEIKCSKCEAHLGHVFPDGPEPTGMRYCVNSCALDFSPATDHTKSA